MEVKKITKEWKIWDKEEKAAKSKEEAKKLVSQKFHKQINIFEKKVSERMPMKKVQDYAIEVKERFVLRKRKVYPLSRKEREEVYEFIEKQLRKGYIRSLKSAQMALVFFVGKKNSKKHMVQDYHYLNEQTIKIIILCLLFQILQKILVQKSIYKVGLEIVL